MLFADAYNKMLKDSVSLNLRERKGGRLIIKSRVQAYEKMGVEDFLSDKWEVYQSLRVNFDMMQEYKKYGW